MEYRKLGRSGLKVSPLCLGAMMFGGPTDEAAAARIIARARDAGVNFIDTADAYNEGRSEEIVGRALGPERDHWVLAKAGFVEVGIVRRDYPERGGIREVRRFELRLRGDRAAHPP